MGRPPQVFGPPEEIRRRLILDALRLAVRMTRGQIDEVMERGKIPGLTRATPKTTSADLRALIRKGEVLDEPKGGPGGVEYYLHAGEVAKAIFDCWRHALIIQEMLGEWKVLPAPPGPCGRILGKLPHARALGISRAKLTGLAYRQWHWARWWEQRLGPYAMEAFKRAMLAGRWPDGYLPGRPSWWGERLWDAMNADPFPAEEEDIPMPRRGFLRYH